MIPGNERESPEDGTLGVHPGSHDAETMEHGHVTGSRGCGRDAHVFMR